MVFDVTIYDSCKDTNANVYTEGGLHRPVPGTALTSGNAVITATDVHPRQSEKYSRMVLPAYWYPSKLRQPVFVVAKEKIRVETGNPQQPYSVTTVAVYGWVDSVRMATENSLEQYSNTATAGENISSVEITWHVDWWLTAGANASYKAGRLKRGPSSYARPDPSTPRLWKTDSLTTVVCNTGLFNNIGRWCIVQYTETSNGHTQIKTLYWPVGGVLDINGTQYTGLNLDNIYAGAVEELFNLDANSVIGAWISPLPPVAPVSGMTPVTSTAGYWFAYSTYNVVPAVFTFSLSGKTTDSAKYIVVDPYGNTMATVPWGLGFDTLKMSVDLGAAGASLLINFNDSTNTSNKGEGEGRDASIPLVTVPITSNNWQSYNISGERAYDIETARIQNEQQLVNGVAGAATAAATGAVMGSIVPGVGTLAGAAVGLGSSLISTGVNFGTGTMYQSQTQTAVDRLMSNQANNLSLGSGGIAWASGLTSGYWKIVKMVRDSVSLAELSAEQSELGYLTDTQVADCTSIISGKGGLRIESLEVYGVAPEGVRYISQMFARGVHLD